MFVSAFEGLNIINIFIVTAAPEITIEANNKHFYGGENLQLKCLVKSLLPVTIRWHFGDKILKELKSRLALRCKHQDHD